ncbi:MAG: HPr(Ser) kinase/phosphatase [Acidobacteriota bacterium]
MSVPPPHVTVGWLLNLRSEAFNLAFEIVAGRGGLDRRILNPYVLKTGLALVGFHSYLQPGRILVFGASEVGYLEQLPPGARRVALQRTLRREVPCALVTDGLHVHPEFAEEAERAQVPLLRTHLPTPVAIAKVTGVLEDRLAERTLLHAVLLDLLGLGVLIVGESGIGKSECALDLVMRGHRLVGDDAIEIRRRAESVLIGTCPELTRYHMEIRGLGVINVEDLFGVSSTRSSKRIELVVQLERWEAGRQYERLGLDTEHFEILGIRVPLVRMPIAPGRNVANLVEVAARNQVLRSRGHHGARDLAARLERQLRDVESGALDPAGGPVDPENE